MSWNRSENKQGPAPVKKGRLCLFRWRGVIVCTAVVLAAVGVLVFIFSGNGDAGSSRARNDGKRQIREVKPAPAPKPIQTNAVKKTKADKDAEFRREVKERWGDNPPEGIKTVLYFMDHPPKQTFKARSQYSYFRHSSERDIASVALAEPGAQFVIQPTYGEQFNQDFINAMLDKIDINDDDSEEVREMKLAVTDAKKEIARICKEEGRKPSEIMNEQAATLYELGKYRQSMEEELRQLRDDPTKSDQDVEDFYTAANQLLAKKGIQSKFNPSITHRAIRLKFLQRKAERQKQKENKNEGN